MSDRHFDDDQAEPVIEALRTWVGTHSAPRQPFFMQRDCGNRPDGRR